MGNLRTVKRTHDDMPVSRIASRPFVSAALLVGLLSACQLTPPAATPVEPTVTPPAATPSPAASSPTATPVASATPVFLDTFDGPTVDTARWNVFEQTGLVAMRDGALELLNMRREPNFPYLVTRSAIFPTSGPFTFEVVYQFRTEGEFVNICLDYMPAETPAFEPLTTPLLRLEKTLAGAKLHAVLPQGDMVVDAAAAVTPGEWHRLRVTFDGTKDYRVLLDGEEIAAFETTRRPSKFWIGQFPPNRQVRAVWPRLAIDEVRVER